MFNVHVAKTLQKVAQIRVDFNASGSPSSGRQTHNITPVVFNIIVDNSIVTGFDFLDSPLTVFIIHIQAWTVFKITKNSATSVLFLKLQ